MTNAGRCRLAVGVIKTAHSVILLVELASIGWLVVTGFSRGGAIRVCPLTSLTERLGASRGAVSDIFRPDVVACTIPIWPSALIVFAAVLHARSALRAALDS
jgi:hypothetical protein